MEKYRGLNKDAVVDYRKVLAQMDKLTDDDEPDVRINNGNVRINGSLNGTKSGTDDTMNKMYGHDSKPDEYV